MTGLLDQPRTDAPEPTPPADGAPVAEVAADRACPSCGAGLSAGQDWCLECGTAQPGRLGSRPGWRAALAVVGLTLFLVTGAVAAAYAALSSDAQRTAAAPAPASGAPVVAQAPQVPAPPAPASDTPVVEAPKSDAAPEPKRVDTPKSDAAASTPSSGGGAASGDADSGKDDASKPDKPAGPQPIALEAGDASTYDPYDRGKGLVGDPDDATDGRASTAWEAPVDANGDVQIGLALSLGQARDLKSLRFRADTPGFTVEIYATTAKKLPPDVLDARWDHVADRRDVDVRERVPLDGRYRHVLLWVTTQPADQKVAIPEVEVLG